jgi:DNA-binding XRE family transcriptional regulator
MVFARTRYTLRLVKTHKNLHEWTPGAQMRAWREAAGLDQPTAAAILDVSQKTISGWEVGASLPRPMAARVIDEAYGLTPGMMRALLDGQEPPEGLVEPRAVDIDAHGDLVWSARYLVRDVPVQRRFSVVS